MNLSNGSICSGIVTFVPDLFDENRLSELYYCRFPVRFTPGLPSWKTLEIKAAIRKPAPEGYSLQKRHNDRATSGSSSNMAIFKLGHWPPI